MLSILKRIIVINIWHLPFRALTVVKSKLKGAQTGHSLLKRKSDALTKRFQDIVKLIEEAKMKMGRVMQTASFSLAEVTYIAGDIR
jgi:V-type H+-transporting ATPase subunit D